MIGRQMQNDDIGERRLRRHVREEFTQRLDPARRGAGIPEQSLAASIDHGRDVAAHLGRWIARDGKKRAPPRSSVRRPPTVSGMISRSPPS